MIIQIGNIEGEQRMIIQIDTLEEEEQRMIIQTDTIE